MEKTRIPALIPTDARLVCLPVPARGGTFAWCTFPLCLQMLHRTLTLAGVKGVPCPPGELPGDIAVHANDTAMVQDRNIFLEDLDFTARASEVANDWAATLSNWIFGDTEVWQKQFQKRSAIVPDSAFDLLCETGTEVQSRVKINDEMKVVETRAIWTEESIPSETILSGIVQCDRIFSKNGSEIKPEGLLETFATNPLVLQVGGKATVGRGQMRCVFTLRCRRWQVSQQTRSEASAPRGL